MIKFFRKIRQQLLMENKTSKYFKYAIGEIILVVIGILIALQINNWNESRIEREKETKLISQLEIDLKKNREEIIDLKKRLEINKDAIDSLIVRLQENKYDFLVPIEVAFTQRKSYFNNAKSGYNLIQNGMAQIISDEVLLKKILDIYENDFQDIIRRQELMHEQIDYFQREFINKFFKIAPNKMRVQMNEFDEVATDLFEPLNFNQLSLNNEFINSLYQLKKSVEIRMVFYDSTLLKLDEVLQLIAN